MLLVCTREGPPVERGDMLKMANRTSEIPLVENELRRWRYYEEMDDGVSFWAAKLGRKGKLEDWPQRVAQQLCESSLIIYV